MNVVIRTEHLSKKYIINHQQKEKHATLRDVIAAKTKSLIKKKANNFPKKEEFWALNNINLEIQQGDRVGIIGKNGAGKSTLLKVLGRITEPSSGKVNIKGRISCLLEVGTGFHAELTGRENIYLNGAILGMKRTEIKNKFDEIVDFSGVEKFLDTPVKRYSSGMYVRLAFAVAAHLESEILIVDEVLAVGDMEFQKKCIGKMEDISKGEGRTILFVSHNIAAIESLCSRGVLLSNGSVLFAGSKNEAITRYIDMYSDKLVNDSSKIAQDNLEFTDFKIFERENEDGIPSTVRAGEKIVLEFLIKNSSSSFRRAYFNFEIKNSQGSYITCWGNEFNNRVLELNGDSALKVTIESENLNLMPNTYSINFYYADSSTIIYKPDFLNFEIISADVYGTGLLPNANQHGVILSKHNISYDTITQN